jgi:parvulin-like peptidyl-prolyl isomerase
MPLLRTVIRLALPLSLVLAACGPAPTTPAPAPTSAETAPEATPESVPPSTEEAPPPPTEDRPLAAQVNGQSIYLVDFERQVAQFETAMIASGEDLSSPETQARLVQVREEILNWMIEQVLVEQTAVQLGILVSDEQVEEELTRIIEEGGGEEAFLSWLEQDGRTRQDAWNELRAEMIGIAVIEQVTPPVPETAEQVHARHIQVDTQEEAERILAQLQAGGDFTELARTYSLDVHTREQGGDLGFFPRGVLMTPEIEEAAFGLQPGQISTVVQSSFGFHIVQVIEREPNLPLGDETRGFLREQAIAQWRESLWAGAQIERYVNP